MRNVARRAMATLKVGTRLCSIVGRDQAAVLRYHRVAGTREHPVPRAVTAEEFAAQLKFLRSRCRVVRLSEIAEAAVEGRPLPPGAVAITFDCGYEDNFSEAFYQLAQSNLPATFFIAAGWVESKDVLWWDRLHEYVRQAAAEGSQPVGCEDLPEPVGRVLAACDVTQPGAVGPLVGQLIDALAGLRLTPEATDLLIEQIAAALGADEVEADGYLPMNWEQIRLLHHGGMEIGSYTVSFARLATVDAERAHEELAFSKMAIENKIGSPVRLVAYPEGSFNEDVADLAEEAGYLAGFTTQTGPVRASEAPYALRRIDISGGKWRNGKGRFSPQLFGLHIRERARITHQTP